MSKKKKKSKQKQDEVFDKEIYILLLATLTPEYAAHLILDKDFAKEVLQETRKVKEDEKDKSGLGVKHKLSMKEVNESLDSIEKDLVKILGDDNE